MRIDVKTRSGRFQGGWWVGGLHISGPRDFVVLVDLGDEDQPPLYWVLPARVAQRLATSDQIRTTDVENYEDRWESLDR